MSAQDIIAELPRLTPEELRFVRARLEALVAQSNVVQQPGPSTDESLRQFLLRIAGTAEGLPDDLALNHDHYLYGTPKRGKR